LLPERKLHSVSFEECAVDLTGPWIIQVHNKPYEFNAFTVVDTVSNLVELVRIDEKTSAHMAQNMLRYSYQDIHGQNDVYTIMVENLQD
jgi:hypothetical protein